MSAGNQGLGTWVGTTPLMSSREQCWIRWKQAAELCKDERVHSHRIPIQDSKETCSNLGVNIHGPFSE